VKIVAYTALLYGQEWLSWAIRSVIDAVDEYHVIYSPRGSHNGNKPVDLPPGEDARTLYEIAHEAAGRKLRWYTHTEGWSIEGEQRDMIFRLAPDADRILVLDYDEVWGPGLAQAVVAASASQPNVREWRVPMIHLWRDLHHAILHDPAYPTRLINPHAPQGTSTTFDAHAHDEAKRELLSRTTDYVPEFHSRIVHGGYAISPELMKAKWETHGHRNEYRREIDWFNDRYMNPAAKTDLHPVGSEYWNAEAIDPFVYLPGWMVDHPLMGEAVAA
jgi:hypothetical protein